MTAINKQRFLPELGKLLTFMVEEDRQTALAMYSRLFDDAADEQQLMDLLVSPTRQAVVIARTYDAKERKQQLESSKEDEAETPAFVLAIDKIYQQVAPKEEKIQGTLEDARNVLENNQFSLFPDDAHPIDDSEYVPFQIEADSVPLEEAVDQLPVETQFSLPEEPAAEQAGEEESPAPAEGEEAAAEEAAPAQEEAPAEAPGTGGSGNTGSGTSSGPAAPVVTAAPDSPRSSAMETSEAAWVVLFFMKNGVCGYPAPGARKRPRAKPRCRNSRKCYRKRPKSQAWLFPN